MTQRYKITVEYDGRPYVGWQRQKNGYAVQAAIEKAIKAFSQEESLVQGSGRTDSGVHALGQVAHFDLEREMAVERIQGALNFHLKEEAISVVAIEEVDSEFHARFDAKKRHYTYRILNRRAGLTFQKGLMWHVKPDLDVAAMQEGANHLIGMHDFTTFRNVSCQAKSPIRTLDYVNIERIGDEVVLTTGALSFLHNQIRSITGTLKMVGAGRWSPDDVKSALEAKDRTRLGHNAPPHGLYFTRVDY